MRIQRLSGRQTLERDLGQFESAMKKTTRTRSIDDKACVNLERLIAITPLNHRTFLFHVYAPEVGFIVISHAEISRLLDEKRIEVRAKPVRVRDAIVRRGRNQQLLSRRRVVRERDSRIMMEESEAALESAGDL